MAKKNKKNSKINQQIRQYFEDDPFDVGVQRVDTKTLSELFLYLGFYDIEPNKALMIKTLRMMWSEADTNIRKEILTFFQNNKTIYKSDKQKEIPLDKEQKLISLLQEFELSHDEEAKLYSFFLQTKGKKITPSKIESKLEHIRFEEKKLKLEKELEGFFDIDDSFEFNASIKYELYDSSFHKIVTLNTKPYSYEYLRDNDFQEIVQKIGDDKIKITQEKQLMSDKFLSSLKNPHPYLTSKEILDAIRSSSPKSTLKYPTIPHRFLKEIIEKKIDAKHIELYEEEVLIEVQTYIKLPLSDILFHYNLQLHIDLDSLLEEIWKGKRFNFEDILKDIKTSHEEQFLHDLTSLIDECKGYALLLNLQDKELHQRVYNFLVELLPINLNITPKVFKKVSRKFLYSIQEELVKKQKEQLLARTIRDFKNLFPVARGMKRKLILHIGETNSGKTYSAMQKLKEADTGYYLAPLRLLALEGYEDLKAQDIECSLITGEEQIIDEEATHISSTIEMMNYDVDVDVCVIDEVQMLDDRDRGWAWVNGIIGAPAKEVIMTGSTNVKDAIIALAQYLGEELEIVEFQRKNKLEILQSHTNIKDVEPSTAIIAFSRKDVLKLKQTFSKDFDVSVVYGNLSPEVRREEARRFREGESNILIATDAIAMGMNLPIKTILFSSATKFDGIMQRELFSSEIHQIAGRAGRYMFYESGYVGALNKDSLKVIQKNFIKPAKEIKPPFKVMASLEHILLVAKILEENSLETILTFFIKNMKFNGPFYASSLDDMLEASKLVDRYNIDIATKYHLACAPLTLKSPYIINAYENYIEALEKKLPVYYKPPKLHASYASTSLELLRAEDMVKEISLYLWLSYRFDDYFVDEKKARTFRGVLNNYIERSLHETNLSRGCRLCGIALPSDSKYKICQSCFKKNYRRSYKR